MVASLPQHAHLFAEHGCFGGKEKGNKKIHVDCADTENARGGKNLTPLPEEFKPLKIDKSMHDAWLKLLEDSKIGAKKDDDAENGNRNERRI